MTSAENWSIRLKQKVRNDETNLFEWRPCCCTIVTRHGNLLLQLQTIPHDEGSEEEDTEEEDAEITTINLATQLINVVCRKNKVRCGLEYYAPVATMSKKVLKMELMTSSAAHCQLFVTQVQRAQQQAHEQCRSISCTSTKSEALLVAPLPSSLTSPRELSDSRVSKTSTTNDAVVTLPAQSAMARDSLPQRRQVLREETGSKMEQSEMDISSALQSSSMQRLRSSSISSSVYSCTLPESLAVAAAPASCRTLEHCSVAQVINDSELDHTIDSSPAFEPEAPPISPISSMSSASATRLPTSTHRRGSISHDSCLSSSSSSSSDNEMTHTSHRRTRQSKASTKSTRDLKLRKNDGHDIDEHKSTLYRGKSSEERHTHGIHGNKLTTTLMSSRGSPPYRQSARTRRSPGWFSDMPRGSSNATAYDDEGESSQAELHILQRVESALRALELENAQAKTRERELLQEIQTLRDTARVAAAERKHFEQENHHARREIDSWRRATQSAEAAATQLQEQLDIAREENQLLAGEKLRLKRQNGDLLTQVHRLDSLVYGRF